MLERASIIIIYYGIDKLFFHRHPLEDQIQNIFLFSPMHF
jgi:hypothetical protein